MSTSDQNSPPSTAGPQVFICYRRRSDAPYARLLRQDLGKGFGAEAVFRDVERIGGGEKFPPKIYAALGACNTFLVLISPDWLEAAGRLHEPEDFVRTEIAAALASGIRIIPSSLTARRCRRRKTSPMTSDANTHPDGWADSDSDCDYHDAGAGAPHEMFRRSVAGGALD